MYSTDELQRHSPAIIGEKKVARFQILEKFWLTRKKKKKPCFLNIKSVKSVKKIFEH